MDVSDQALQPSRQHYVPDNITVDTKMAAQKLLDVFETRYIQRFDSLVGDALRVEKGADELTSAVAAAGAGGATGNSPAASDGEEPETDPVKVS